MKNVLIVDDEKSFLLSLVEGLVTFAGDFNTLTAQNGRRAVEILSTTSVDLVVTDLKMPEMDGFELLAYMSKNFPGVPVIVMTAYCTPEIKERLEKMGAFHVLEKPLDFRELVDGIFAELTAVSKGYLRGITLPAFLQLVEMERKTCTVKVMSKGRTGFLYFNDGELMNADSGREKGEKAAYEIVCWDEAEIELSSICREKAREINSSLSHILMEGFRLKDEGGRPGEDDQRVPEDSGAAADIEKIGDSLLASLGSINKNDTNPAEGRDEKEEKMAGLKEILNEFTKLAGVNAVCLVGRDGFLLDSIARTGIDSEMVGAIASSGFGASEAMGRQLGKGEMSMSMIEFEKGPVMFSPVGGDAFLVIIADKDANLGMIRLKLKKYSGELAVAAAI